MIGSSLSHLVPKCKHNSMLIAWVWHSGVIKPQISQSNIAFREDSLNRRTDFSTCFHKFFFHKGIVRTEGVLWRAILLLSTRCGLVTP